jgi:hypothetical protein
MQQSTMASRIQWRIKLRGLSPQVNYTERAKLVSRGRRNGSPRPLFSVFYTRSRYFSIQVVPQLYWRGWVDPVPDLLLLRKSGSTGNRTWVLWIWSQEFWPQRRSQWRIRKIKQRLCPSWVQTKLKLDSFFIILIYCSIKTRLWSICCIRQCDLMSTRWK